MTVDRRTFLFGGGGVAVLTAGVAGVYSLGGPTDDETETTGEQVDDAPDDVSQLQPLAEAYLQELRQHADELRVFINRDGEIAAEYATTAESEEALISEIHRYADLFATVIADGEYEPATLSIITDEVQAIVPEDTVDAYVADEINQDAFHETIEVTAVGRPDDE